MEKIAFGGNLTLMKRMLPCPSLLFPFLVYEIIKLPSHNLLVVSISPNKHRINIIISIALHFSEISFLSIPRADFDPYDITAFLMFP